MRRRRPPPSHECFDRRIPARVMVLGDLRSQPRPLRQQAPSDLMTEWRASDYHRHSSLQQAMAEEQLGRLTLEGGERILDVGCGDGKVTADIAARVSAGSVVG